MTGDLNLFYRLTGLACILLFLAAVPPAALLFRQKRLRMLPLSFLLVTAPYLCFQCVIFTLYHNAGNRAAELAGDWFAALPREIIVLALALTLIGTALIWRETNRYERTHITPLSVKAAVDSLPAGVLVYLPGGRIVMINRAMERFAFLAMGALPVNGEKLRDDLSAGRLRDGCVRESASEDSILILPDGTAWSLSEIEFQYDGMEARRLLATEITEDYHITRALRLQKEQLEASNARLTEVNREIVRLAAERERLSARIRLHDQMGEDLLRLKRCLRSGGAEDDRGEMEAMLRRNVSFIKTDRQRDQLDEYALMAETARALGMTLAVEGSLPQTEPQKRILATAIHECLTNTLRHAHGHMLRVEVSEQEGLTVALTSDGDQPKGPVEEKGGLKILRQLTETAGGRMTVVTEPGFVITLWLPKEAQHVV